MTRLRVFTLLALWLAGAALLAAVSPALSYADTPTTGMVSPDKAASAAVDTFYRLTDSNAELLSTETYLVYRPDTEAVLERADIELVPKDYLVLLTGRVLRRSIEMYQNPAATRTISALYRAAEVYQEGIVGRLQVDLATGVPYTTTTFTRRPLARLHALAVGDAEARDVIETNIGTKADEAYLVEIIDHVFAWSYSVGTEAHYVDARTGYYLSKEQMGLRAQEMYRSLAFMPEGAAGAQFTLTPVFREQGMHQYQFDDPLDPPDRVNHFGGLCSPTALSMVFDYFGEEIYHVDIADVSTAPGGGGTHLSDIERAAMFSHNSTAARNYLGDDPTGPGYAERRYGYSACYEDGLFDFTWRNNAWNVVVELTEERCPFIPLIIRPNGNGHSVVVIGYKIDDLENKHVAVADPVDPNFAESDDGMWWAWDGDNGFHSLWMHAACIATVVRPMPVELALTWDTVNDRLTITATVRTCHEFPACVPGGEWTNVNRDCELKGNLAGNSEDIPITITYPNVTKVSGNDTQYWDPDGVDDASGTFEWVFDATDPDLPGAEFKVVATGWAAGYEEDDYVGYDSESYQDQNDELFGWAAVRIDEHLFRVEDSTGNTVAAIGDQGNIDVEFDGSAPRLSEWASSLSQTAAREFVVKHGATVVSRFDEGGDIALTGVAHGGMDDVNDGASDVVPWTPWTLAELIDEDDTQFQFEPYGGGWDLRYDFPFYIQIHDEILKVTDFVYPYPDEFVVVRGQEGTTPQVHDQGAPMTLYARAFLLYAISAASTTLKFHDHQGDKFPVSFLSFGSVAYPFVDGTFSRCFSVKVDDEIMLVTNVEFSDLYDMYTLTVVRGRGGTEAEAHATNASVTLNLGEQFALNTTPGWPDDYRSALKIRDGNADVVAYIDAEGHIRHKGMIFENWSDWDYWD